MTLKSYLVRSLFVQLHLILVFYQPFISGHIGLLENPHKHQASPIRVFTHPIPSLLLLANEELLILQISAQRSSSPS